MLIAAAVCPHPPVLVPEAASGFAAELDGLRSACDAAIGRLFDAEPEVLIVVGGADRGSPTFQPTGSFHAYGVDLTVDLGIQGDVDDPQLPLSLLIAAWLLRDRPSANPPRSAFGTGPDADPGFCDDLGRRFAARDARIAMLVMGDGSACRSLQAPGHFDERAEAYDAAVATALGSGDYKALAGLDPVLSSELIAAGRAPWQVLAGAAAASEEMVGRGFSSELLYADAPYGVGYFVASWRSLAEG